MDSWKQAHGESALIRSIQVSNFDIFRALLDSGEDINSNDYLCSRDGRLPTLPIHAAAANSDPRFLRTLIEHGADPDDCRADPCGPYPEFDNVFRTAVRAGQWENVKIIVEAKGVHGDLGCDGMWELHRSFLNDEFGTNDANDEEGEEFARVTDSLFRMSWDQLLQLSQFPLARHHRPQRHWNSIACGGLDHHDDEELHELTNLDWTVNVKLSHLDDSRRLAITDQLLRGGAEVSCYTSSSHFEMWDRRASALRDSPPSLYDSPIPSLGTSYHTVSTPLHTCVLRGNSSLFKHLVSEREFNPNVPEFSTRAYTPLFLALSHMDLQMAAIVIEMGGRIDYIAPIMHVTALHIAAATRNIEVFQWVLAQLQSIERSAAERVYEQRSLLGHTPLHVACLPTYSDDTQTPGSSETMPYVLTYTTSRPPDASQDFLDILIATGNGRWRWTDGDHLGVTAQQYMECCRANGTRLD